MHLFPGPGRGPLSRRIEGATFTGLSNYCLSGKVQVESRTKRLHSIVFCINDYIDYSKPEPSIAIFETLLKMNYGKPDEVIKKPNDLLTSLGENWYYSTYKIELLVFYSPIAEKGESNIILSKINNKLSSASTKSNNEVPNFRSSHWGDNKSDVILQEGQPNIFAGQEGADDNYSFNTFVADMHCQVCFQFIEDKLVSGVYYFKQSHTNQNDFIKDYNNLFELLSKKYGAPIKDEEIWSNELYRDELDQYGFAVSIGHLSYLARWIDDVTEINLALMGDNYQADLILTYTGRKYKGKLENMTVSRQIKGL